MSVCLLAQLSPRDRERGLGGEPAARQGSPAAAAGHGLAGVREGPRPALDPHLARISIPLSACLSNSRPPAIVLW